MRRRWHAARERMMRRHPPVRTVSREAVQHLTSVVADRLRLVDDLEQERLQLRVRLTVLSLLLR